MCVTAYDWAGLPEDGIVLDVGGGIGNASLSIAQTNEKVKIVVQDVAPVAEAGKEVSYTFCSGCGVWV